MAGLLHHKDGFDNNRTDFQLDWVYSEYFSNFFLSDLAFVNIYHI